MQVQARNPINLLSLPAEILDLVFHAGDMEPKDLSAKSRVCKLFYQCIMVTSNNHYWKISVLRHFPFKNVEYRFRSAPYSMNLFKAYVLERKKIDQAKAVYLTQGKEAAVALSKVLLACNKPCLANAVLQPFRSVAPMDPELAGLLRKVRSTIASFNLIQIAKPENGGGELLGPLYFLNAAPPLLFAKQTPELTAKIKEYEKIVLPLALALADAVFCLKDPQEVSAELYAILYPFEVLSTQSELLHFLLYKTYAHPGSSFYNKRAAMEFLNQSAIKQFAPALVALADIDAEGLRSNRNYDRAFSYYGLAAGKGDRLGITRLGKCFELGIGTKINLPKALECYEAAVKLGCPEGAYRLGLFLKIYEKTSSKELIFGLFCKAAEGGLTDGAFQKGRCLETGFGVERNLDLAKQWYLAAKTANHSEAGLALEKMVRPRSAVDEANQRVGKKQRVDNSPL